MRLSVFSTGILSSMVSSVLGSEKRLDMLIVTIKQLSHCYLMSRAALTMTFHLQLHKQPKTRISVTRTQSKMNVSYTNNVF